jgi:hypothetical protein
MTHFYKEYWGRGKDVWSQTMFCGQAQIQILKQLLHLKKLCIIPKTSHSSWNLVAIIYFTLHISSGCFLKIFLRSCCCFYKLNISIIFHGNGTWNKVYFTELVVFIFIIITVIAVTVFIIILYCVLFFWLISFFTSCQFSYHNEHGWLNTQATPTLLQTGCCCLWLSTVSLQ